MKNNPTYPDLFPNIEDWPIYKLHASREEFIGEIVDFCLNRFQTTKTPQQLADLIARTIYMERIRMNEEPWKVDPPNERQFWKKIRRELIKKGLDSEAEQQARTNEVLMERIIRRYAEEIVGTFKVSTFRFARKFLTAFFKRLLNTAAAGSFGTFWGSKKELYEKLRVYGPLDEIRELAKKGTLVILPTHSSNLDSILVGYAMDAVLGLPSFSYGAGLNLYNSGIVAYYMNRLGAYRVDRRKKNPIYLETLKGMSTLSLQKGTNSLFFPGGTRSRSGMLEDKLKLGLLSTAVEAQRALFQKEEDRKVIIVPLIISYNFVLEARFLIHNYLKRAGKERYLKTRDQSFSIRKITKFIWQFFAAESEITLSFGHPMDVLGNRLDANAVSYDQFDRPVNLRDYFELNGQLNTDLQRESEYTRELAQSVVRSYFRDNMALSSHVVAYLAFRILCHENPDLDLFAILRLPLEDFAVPLSAFVEKMKAFQAHLIQMEKEGRIKLAETVTGDPEALVRDGISRLGTYHPRKPLKVNKKEEVISEEFSLLFFYHNRLENYGLEKVVKKLLAGLQAEEA